jgi:hypothetical protein
MYLYQRKKLKPKNKKKIISLPRAWWGPRQRTVCRARAVGTGSCVPTARPGPRQRPVNWVFNAVNSGQAFDEGSLFADGTLDLAVGTVCDS